MNIFSRKKIKPNSVTSDNGSKEESVNNSSEKTQESKPKDAQINKKPKQSLFSLKKNTKEKVNKKTPNPFPLGARPIVEENTIELNEKTSHESWHMAYILSNTEHKRVIKLLKVSASITMLLTVLLGAVFYWGIFYKKDIYFQARDDGSLQEMIPLDQPYVSMAGISNWATKAVTETFTLNFYDYKSHLSQVQEYYDDDAWISLERELRPIIKSIVDNNMFVVAIADQAPKIIFKGMYTQTKYAWRLQFPMTLTYQLPNSVRTFKWNVDLIIQRTDIPKKYSGVEITQFIITPR